MDACWHPLPRARVTITGGFWKGWRDLIGERTLDHQLAQMRAQGQWDALLLDPLRHRGRKLEEEWYWGGSIFWDSDLAKWLEAAAARYEQQPDEGLLARMDEVIARFEKAQLPDGYVNSHILTWRPRHRFKNLRDLHELYCAGHLIEAAVVHREATGQERLLDVARRFADHLVARFGRGPGQLRGYCGHPEIELALLRLFHLTGERRYLDLCRYMIDERGQEPPFFEAEAVARLDARPFRPDHPGSPFAYMQAHEPVRDQRKVVGHAVRAMYLFAAVAGLAAEDRDEGLLAACDRAWQDVLSTKLYVTGGIGSASANEGFTRDYDLPNENAYAETCASIGLFLFAHRLQQVRLDGSYGDVMERALYNNILSGIGLDGQSFFYENPLASRGAHERLPWPWWCPCCPPNLARLLGSLSGYLVSERGDGVAVHLYADAEVRGEGWGLRMESGLPYDGTVRLELRASGPAERSLYLRVPAWARGHEVRLNGAVLPVAVTNGYAEVRRVWTAGDVLALHLGMETTPVFSRYEVEANRGRLALTRGPLVYCLEEADNGGGLDALTLRADAPFEPCQDRRLPPGTVGLRGPGSREIASDDALYAVAPPETVPVTLTAVPYYAWANRDPGEMRVWIRRATENAVDGKANTAA